MLFKVEENLPALAVELLRSAGHDAVSVLDQSLYGRADQTIADVCRSEGRAILSLDLDFADIRNFPPSDYFGIVVLHPVERIIPMLGVEPLTGQLWIVDEHRIRIRGDSASDVSAGDS